MENTPVSAVTVTANPLGLPENDPYNQLSHSLDDGHAAKKEEEKKKQEKNQQQRLLDIQKQNENDKKMQEENNQRTIASQVLTSAIQRIKENEANGDPVENMEDAKEMIGMVMDGGMSAAAEGMFTSGASEEEDENSTKNNPSTTSNQQPPVTVIPRR